MGAFTTTLKNRVANIAKELKATKEVAQNAATNGNASLMNSLLSPLAKYKPFGGDTIMKGFNNLGYAANRVDTAVGAVLRGNAKPGSVRYGLFTETANSTLPQVKDSATGVLRNIKPGETAQYMKIVPRASATTALGVPTILFTSGAAINTLSNALDKKDDTNQVKYYQVQQPTYNSEGSIT